MNLLLKSLSVLALAAAALAASAQVNLVQNPGFESAFANYTAFGAPSGATDTIYARTGSLGLSLNPPSSSGFYQDVPTSVGGLYLVSFFARSGTAGFSFGSGSLTATAGAAYAQYSFTGLATSTSTRLSFSSGGATAVQLDDLSVTALNPTPEPSALAALGLGSMAFVKRRKRA